MKQYIRKADIILFIALVAVGIAASAALSLSHGDAGTEAKVVIKSNGSLFATYSLYEDRTITVPAPNAAKVGSTEAAQSASSGDGAAAADGSTDGDDAASKSSAKADGRYDYYNIVEIKNGSVSVSEASCKNQVCVRHGSISRAGESIVCLPNRLVITIEGGAEKGGGYDAVTS